MRINSLNISVRGPLHILEGKPNQDATLIKTVSTGWLAVVCDGMGSKPFSGKGATLGCKAVFDTVKANSFAIDAKDLIKSIYQLWLSYLGHTKPTDAVTTCLFCWVSHSGDARFFQLGDGKIITSKIQTTNETSTGFSNETTGLGKSTKFSDWKVSTQNLAQIEFVALLTDGISEDIQPGMETDFVSHICTSISGKSKRQIKTWLKDELKNWATPNHTDDKSIGLPRFC